MFKEIDKTYWGVLLIIGGITGVLSGFIGPDLIHNTLFKHGDTFWIITPLSANISMFVAAGFFVLFCVGMIFENKKWNYLGIFFLALSIFMGYYANFGNYTLVSENSITFKKFMTKEVYRWDDIEEAIYIEDRYKKEENITVEGDKKFHLTFKNNKKETFEIPDSTMANKIKQKLKEYDIDFQSK